MTEQSDRSLRSAECLELRQRLVCLALTVALLGLTVWLRDGWCLLTLPAAWVCFVFAITREPQEGEW